jgi:hypothetical protein
VGDKVRQGAALRARVEHEPSQPLQRPRRVRSSAKSSAAPTSDAPSKPSCPKNPPTALRSHDSLPARRGPRDRRVPVGVSRFLVAGQSSALYLLEGDRVTPVEIRWDDPLTSTGSVRSTRCTSRRSYRAPRRLRRCRRIWLGHRPRIHRTLSWPRSDERASLRTCASRGRTHRRLGFPAPSRPLLLGISPRPRSLPLNRPLDPSPLSYPWHRASRLSGARRPPLASAQSDSTA